MVRRNSRLSLHKEASVSTNRPRELVPWVGFETEIHRAIITRMAAMNIAPNTEYDIGSMPKKRPIVTNEAGVRMEAKRQMHELVVEVLEILKD